MFYKRIWYCRWCGKPYKPLKETDRDGFCCSACKQAHYRAYKKYVTLQARAPEPAAGQGVTRKTHASSGAARSETSQRPHRKK